MKPALFAAVAVLALGACHRGASDQDASIAANSAAADAANTMASVPPAAPGDAGVTTDPATYVAQAGAGDMFEIESSRAILAKTKNADVKRFAHMMIDNHQMSTNQIKQAAGADNITVAAPMLRPDQQTMLDDVKSADAATADRVYLQHQRTAHTAALALHQGFARSSNTGKLVAVAGQIAPIVQKHLTELDRVEASIIGGK